MKMKNLHKILCLGLMCGLMGCAGGASAGDSTVIVDAANGKTLSVQQLAQKLKPYQAVFFGEFHDQDSLHLLEYSLLQKMYALHGDKLVLSMEMFEADNQSKLDGYLAGSLSEEDFVNTARPWPRYKTDYRPMIEFAKEHKIPVIAANIPRFLAAVMAKEGTVENVEPQYRPYLPRHTYAPEGKYKEKFTAYMTKGEGQMRIPPARIGQVFAAQCIKDDKMAESIYDYLQANKDKVVLHINGCFHSDGHLGTVEKLEALAPVLKVAVISPKDLPADKNYSGSLEKDKEDGEFLVYFPRVNKE